MGKIASRFWDNIEKYICILGLLIMLTVTFINILSRFFLKMSFSFMEGLTINLFVWVTLFGSSIAVRRGAHLGLSILTDRSIFLRKVSIILTAVGSTFLYLLIGWFGFDLMKTQMAMDQLASWANIPEWTLTLSIPIGCLVIVIRFLETAYYQWKEELKK